MTLGCRQPQQDPADGRLPLGDFPQADPRAARRPGAAGQGGQLHLSTALASAYTA